MPGANNNLRAMLTWAFAPVIIALLAAPVVSYYQFYAKADVNFNDVYDYLYRMLSENWRIAVGIYTGHFVLLFPFVLTIKRLHKLRLMFFLPGAYIIGSIVTFFGSIIAGLMPLEIDMVPGLLLLSVFTGGTYGFFQGYLSWHMAGLHHQSEEKLDATAN